MVKAKSVAKYFLSLDPERIYFNKNLIEREGNKFYEGNARLNKLMHLSQNIFIAMKEMILIDDDFYAYNNGAVIPSIQENYAKLLNEQNHSNDLSDETKIFLKKIFDIFVEAPIEELIEIDHEDPEWLDKHKNYYKNEQKMDALAHIEDYKTRYKDIITLLNRMETMIA